ncbi:cation:proton antiporter [Ningiella sp. W23]|uniref:cation:proton antiporter n=1 Tax=Ningiella sp. W23 TaxID=3023715 RepID=UPI003758169A
MLDIIHQSSFFEITALLVLATLIGLLGTYLRQPLIVCFIIVGLLAGPSVLDIVHSRDKIELLSELGIAILLFLVGIKLDVTLIRSIGPVSLLTGLGQVFFTSLIGYFIGIALGFDSTTSIYVAVALTFSSTIIIVKLLSDKREIDALHGQIALGFLIVQDLVVVFSMIVLAAIGMGSGQQDEPGDVVLKVAMSGVLLLGFVVLFIKYLANPLTVKLAKTPELLVVFALALATLFATIGKLVGLGMELGGLLAGIAVASTPVKESISSRLAPLRDFLLLFFFIALGATLDLSTLGNYLFEAVIFSLFVLVGNPLIVLAIMGALGYRKRTGFLAGLTVAQISEFSLIFIAMAVSLGHIQSDILGLVTLVGIITIASSTYMITYSHTLFRWCEPALGLFEKQTSSRESAASLATKKQYDVIVFGLGRFGTSIAKHLQKAGFAVLAVDFNPDVHEQAKAIGVHSIYGDVTDAEFVAELPLQGTQWIVVTIPTHHLGLVIEDTRKTIFELSKATGYSGRLAIVSHSQHETDKLKQAGIDLVLQPYSDASMRATELLLQGLAMKTSQQR